MNPLYLSQLRRSKVFMKQNDLEFDLGYLKDLEIEGQGSWKMSKLLIESHPNISESLLKVPSSDCVQIDPQNRRILIKNDADLKYATCSEDRRIFQLCGYSLQCGDNFVGVVEDFVVDIDTWQLQTLVVESFRSNWKDPFFYIPTHWILSVDHKHQQLQLWLSEKDLESAFKRQTGEGQEQLIESYAYWEIKQSEPMKGVF